MITTPSRVRRGSTGSVHSVQDELHHVHEPPVVMPRRVELHLAVVYHGGMSSAVYSFGHSHEIRQLWVGSSAFDKALLMENGKRNQQRPTSGTARIYFDLLQEMYEHHNIHISVQLDEISGTGAGGINAVFLGKSLMSGASTDAVKKFWLDEVDVRKLRFEESAFSDRPLVRRTLAWTTGFILKLGQTANGILFSDPASRVPLPAEYMQYGTRAAISSLPLFDGQKLVRSIACALTEMDQESVNEQRDIMQAPLRLYTTFTNVTPIRRQTARNEGRNSTTLQFERAHFYGPNANRELIFAARASSALPIAFAGVTLKEGAEMEMTDCHGNPIPAVFPEKFLRSQLRRYTVDSNGIIPQELMEHECVDGSIMLHRPIKPLLDELNKGRRTLGQNIQRRVLFVDPSPGPSHGKSTRPSPNVRPNLFANEINRTSYGPLLEAIQGRFEAKRAAAMKKGLLGNVYDWIPHAVEVSRAVITLPIEDELQEVSAFNARLKSANDLALRALHRAKFTAWERFGDVRLGNHQYVRCFWYGDMNFNPNEIPCEMLYFSCWKLASVDEQRAFLEERFESFRLSMTTTLASPKFLHFPESSSMRKRLAKKVAQYFPKPVISWQHLEQGFDMLVNNDLFFLRDLLFSMVRVLENPTWMADQVNIKVVSMSPIVRDVSRFIQGKISELDRLISTPPMKGLLDFSSWESWTDKQFDALRRDWHNKFTHTFLSVLRGMEEILHHAAKEDEKCLRQLVYRPLFIYSYYEVASFISSADTTLDNAVTKAVRLSPDKTDEFDHEPPTLLFRDARQIIREEGLLSFSEVILRSTDYNNCAGLMERKYREFDMVWARLDASEQLCQTICDVALDESRREASDMVIATGGRSDLLAERCTFDKSRLPLFSLNAAREVLAEEVCTTSSNPTVLDPENTQFFNAMMTQIDSRLKSSLAYGQTMEGEGSQPG